MGIRDLYKNCRLCPRDCGVDRLEGRGGYCGESAGLRLAFAGLHRGEEPPLSGEGGSGTVFVSGCNLRCALCQNWQISGGLRPLPTPHSPLPIPLGRIVATEEFAEICLALQNSGAENVNIVTGSHAVPALVEGLTAAKAQGMGIPVVWNSSGYEKPETLDLLDGLVDTWLPDLKTLDTALAEGNLGPVGPRCRVAERLFNAPNYPDAAIAAILWMLNKPGKVIIRHLILPGYLDSTRAVLRWFADNAGGKGALLSLMSQYTPVGIRDSNSDNNPQSLIPSRYLNKHEYDTVLGWLGEFGIEDGFCQDYVTGSDWLPDFNRENPFSSELSVPVWHYKREIKNEKVKN